MSTTKIKSCWSSEVRIPFGLFTQAHAAAENLSDCVNTVEGEMHLEYRVFQAQGLGNLQMPGQVAMAGYHFSINAERLGLDPKTVRILIGWPEGKTDECRFLIDAPIAEETLRLAFHNALRSAGLGAEQS